MQWGDFDLKLGTLKISRTVCRISCGNGHTKVVIQTPKTRTSRREIPIPKQLLIMLKKLRGCVSNATWFLSGNESKPTEPRCYRKSIKAYLKQSTIRQVRPHALRHTCLLYTSKAKLFSKVRSGQVRVLLGSTAKMGAGTNVQTLLVAVHHLDVGWRPSDMTQRNGRIIRQGNQNKQVYVYNYVTESTFDAYLYQTLENKMCIRDSYAAS